jgi:hypothetical protein
MGRGATDPCPQHYNAHPGGDSNSSTKVPGTRHKRPFRTELAIFRDDWRGGLTLCSAGSFGGRNVTQACGESEGRFTQ